MRFLLVTSYRSAAWCPSGSHRRLHNIIKQSIVCWYSWCTLFGSFPLCTKHIPDLSEAHVYPQACPCCIAKAGPSLPKEEIIRSGCRIHRHREKALLPSLPFLYSTRHGYPPKDLRLQRGCPPLSPVGLFPRHPICLTPQPQGP